MSHLSHHRALDFAEDSVPTAPETVVVEANRSWNSWRLRVCIASCASCTLQATLQATQLQNVTKAIKGNQRLKVRGLMYIDIQGTKFADFTFWRPFRQKLFPRGELQKKR